VGFDAVLWRYNYWNIVRIDPTSLEISLEYDGYCFLEATKTI
jgi:hypothetical protein